jgi:hypothetical protein
MWRCPEYTRLTVKERLVFVRRDKRCANCLSKHEGIQCPSRYICFRCNIKHNSTLCPLNERNRGGVFANIHAYNNETFNNELEEEQDDNLNVSLHGSKEE